MNSLQHALVREVIISDFLPRILGSHETQVETWGYLNQVRKMWRIYVRICKNMLVKKSEQLLSGAHCSSGQALLLGFRSVARVIGRPSAKGVFCNRENKGGASQGVQQNTVFDLTTKWRSNTGHQISKRIEIHWKHGEHANWSFWLCFLLFLYFRKALAQSVPNKPPKSLMQVLRCYPNLFHPSLT